MFTPEKFRLLPIGLGLGLMAGVLFSFWLVRVYMPKSGWNRMWALHYKIIFVLTVLIALIALARLALFLLGYEDLAAAL